MCSVLNQAVIIFSPQYGSNKSKKALKREFSRTVLLLGLCIGIAGGTAIILLFNLVPQMFSPQVALWSKMQAVAPMALMALALNGLDTVLEGLLIANGYSRYLGAAMWINCLVVFLFTTISSKLSSTVGLISVWSCLVVFFISRVSLNFFKTRKIFFSVN